jgi:N-acetylglucosaminyldiphosphoundecaprenol N-acetyl-beta-D-mannosaminyltransferase
MPVVWWAKRHGIPQAERVYGPDLMEAVIDIGRRTGARHYLYGSTQDVLDALTRAIDARWPGAEIAGIESPPFRELSDTEVDQSVRRAESSGATVVWVGMGTPKQDLLVHRMSASSDLTFVAIGAAFDFIAGTKSQAPRWMMKIGMEWFYRLVSEPRRLWKRYLVYNAKFLRLLWRSRTTGEGAQGLKQ